MSNNYEQILQNIIDKVVIEYNKLINEQKQLENKYKLINKINIIKRNKISRKIVKKNKEIFKKETQLNNFKRIC